ncbi:hypothetical protein ACS0TY_021793 [Phlomoides rotata]
MTLILMYHKTGTFPENRVQACQLQLRAARYIILNEHLYKRRFFLPLLNCITREQGQKVLTEIHNEVCGNHVMG